MWLLISGNIPCEIYRQFNIHHPICLPAQISLNMLVHCSCPFMGLYLAWVQCGLCSKKLCFLWCQSVLKGLIDVWEYVLSTRRASMMGPATDRWNRAQEDSLGLLYKWGWSHFYSPKTEWLFSLFLVMWYPMHPLHIPNANSLCLLTDTSGAAKEQVCVSGHKQMPMYIHLTQMDMHFSLGGVYLWGMHFQS